MFLEFISFKFRYKICHVVFQTTFKPKSFSSGRFRVTKRFGSATRFLIEVAGSDAMLILLNFRSSAVNDCVTLFYF